MKILTPQFSDYLTQLLEVEEFKDYAPNGLQVEGKKEIKRVVFGVSASYELINRAIDFSADAIVTHHGYFWKNEKLEITGIKAARIKALMKNNINLFAYHLPLDANKQLGNNAELGKLLGINNPITLEESLVWRGNWQGSLSEFSNLIEKKLARKPLVIQANARAIKNIAWCTGAAQDYLEYLIDKNIAVDTYLSGEISERTPLIAKESGINYIAAGHHATERYGIKALCLRIKKDLNLVCQFIDIDNPA